MAHCTKVNLHKINTYKCFYQKNINMNMIMSSIRISLKTFLNIFTKEKNIFIQFCIEIFLSHCWEIYNSKSQAQKSSIISIHFSKGYFSMWVDIVWKKSSYRLFREIPLNMFPCESHLRKNVALYEKRFQCPK